MALRLKSEIIPRLFNQNKAVKAPEIVQPVVQPVSIKKEVAKPKTVDELAEIIKEKPKPKVVREYFRNQVEIINQKVDQEFLEKII